MDAANDDWIVSTLVPMKKNFQANLYKRLQAFELDDPAHQFGFTRHLMRNQGWTLDYAQRAIIEYKKFAFLTVVVNHQVTPSDQVDQVWHTHLIFTQSYWEEFCPKVLKKTLHHHPTRGGRAERAKFHHLYAQTIASYRQFFGSPPVDIWSPPDVRFGAVLKMQRVNLSEHWVIPKRLPQLHLAKTLSIIALMACILTISWSSAAEGFPIGQAATDISSDPFFIAICGCIIFGLILRYIIRSPSRQPQKPQLDSYQIAYLAGGNSRAVELAIVQLVRQGYLHPNVHNRTFAIKKRLPSEASTLEQQVMQQVQQNPTINKLRAACLNISEIKFVRSSLEQKKLLIEGWSAVMGLSFALLLCMAVLGGVLLCIIDILIRIVTFGEFSLVFIMSIPDIQQHLYMIEIVFMYFYFAMLLITLCCFTPREHTRWGSQILAEIEKTHDTYDVIQRFALSGYKTLSGGSLDDLKQMLTDEAKEDAASGCGC